MNIQYFVELKNRSSLTKESITDKFSQVTGAHFNHTHLIPPRQHKNEQHHILNVNVNPLNLRKILTCSLENKGFKLKYSPEFNNHSTIVFKGNANDIRVITRDNLFKKGRNNEKFYEKIECRSVRTAGNSAFILLKDPLDATRYAETGFYVNNSFIRKESLSAYRNNHVRQCYHCYEWGDHTTSQCKKPRNLTYCSLCFSNSHRYNDCHVISTAKGPRCRNCKGPHPAISKGCPVAKNVARHSKPPTRQPLTYRASYTTQPRKNPAAIAKNPKDSNIPNSGEPRSAPYYPGQTSYADKLKSPPREVIPKDLPKKAPPKKAAPPKPVAKIARKPVEPGKNKNGILAPAKKSIKHFKNEDPSVKLPEVRKNIREVANLIKAAEDKNHELRFVREDGHCFYHSMAAIYRHSYDVDTNFKQLRVDTSDYISSLSKEDKTELTNFLVCPQDNQLSSSQKNQ